MLLQRVIEELKNPYLSLLDIAKHFNVSQITISKINEGITYTNPNINYPIRDKNFHAQKPIEDFLSEDDLLLLKEYIKFRWDLSLEIDIPKQFNISKNLVRDINHGRKYSEYGNYTYPIRNKNIHNKNKLTQKDILLILDRLKNTKDTMEQIGKDFNFGRATIGKINRGEAYIIKDYNYPARKTK